MLEYIAAQTQVLQAMAQTMVKIHQSITEQASLPKDHNTVTNDNHQNMTSPTFDKEKLSAMQTQVSYLRPLQNKHLWAAMCRGGLAALYPRSNRPVQDKLGCMLTRWRGRSLPPMSRSFGTNLESFSAIRGPFICHFSCQFFSTQIGLSLPDHHILAISSFGLMRPNQVLRPLQLHSVHGKRLLSTCIS
jgi:hypothetical protein